MKKFYMVIDTETLSDWVFNIGFQVIDRNGTVYERGSYVIDSFINDPDAWGAFTDRFMGGEKIARYYDALYRNQGKYRVVSFEDVRAILNAIRHEYNAIPAAYNASFDALHLDKTAQLFSKPSFFMEPVAWLDIWGIALGTWGTNKKYLTFCREHGLTTPTGNPKSGAEAVYRFISGDASFEEEHTALADVEIECAILVDALKKKKKLHAVESVSPCFHDAAWQNMIAAWQDMN